MKWLKSLITNILPSLKKLYLSVGMKFTLVNLYRNEIKRTLKKDMKTSNSRSTALVLSFFIHQNCDKSKSPKGLWFSRSGNVLITRGNCLVGRGRLAIVWFLPATPRNAATVWSWRFLMPWRSDGRRWLNKDIDSVLASNQAIFK